MSERAGLDRLTRLIHEELDMILWGELMASCIEDKSGEVLPLARYTRVQPTDAYFVMYPKSRNRIKLGIIVGHARKSIGYRVQWDGQVIARTVSPRLIKAIPYGSD